MCIRMCVSVFVVYILYEYFHFGEKFSGCLCDMGLGLGIGTVPRTYHMKWLYEKPKSYQHRNESSEKGNGVKMKTRFMRHRIIFFMFNQN